MTVKFVIIAQPRTGSTLLCSLFNSCPDVRALIEPINPATHNHHMRPTADTPGLLPEHLITHNLVRALQILFSPEKPLIVNNYRRGEIAAGFKIMVHQITALANQDVFWTCLKEWQVKVIVCLRYNIVMQYVSDLIAQHTGQAACWDGRVKTAKVMVPIDSLESELRRLVVEKRWLLQTIQHHGLMVKRIRYEDFKNDVGAAEKLLWWLTGINTQLKTKLVKQNPDSLVERVINYDDLVKALKCLNLTNLLV